MLLDTGKVKKVRAKKAEGELQNANLFQSAAGDESRGGKRPKAKRGSGNRKRGE